MTSTATIDRALHLLDVAASGPRAFGRSTPEQIAAAEGFRALAGEVREWMGDGYENAPLELDLIRAAAKRLMANAVAASPSGGFVVDPMTDEVVEVISAEPMVDADVADIRNVTVATGRDFSISAGAIFATPEMAAWARDYYSR